MPEHPTLREGFLAWDRGDYPEALRAYLEVLNSRDGAEHVEEIALLTGELYEVTEVAVDGTRVAIAPDGSTGIFEVVEDGTTVTKVVDLSSASVVETLSASGVALGPAYGSLIATGIPNLIIVPIILVRSLGLPGKVVISTSLCLMRSVVEGECCMQRYAGIIARRGACAKKSSGCSILSCWSTVVEAI